MEYYIKKHNRIIGPFSAERIKHMISTGKVSRDDSISPDKETWKTAGNIDGLFDEPKSAKRRAVVRRQTRAEDQTSLPDEQQGENGEQRHNTNSPLRIAKPQNDNSKSSNSTDSGHDKDSPPHQSSDGISPGMGMSSIMPNTARTNYFSILWNPLHSIPAIYEERGERGAALGGLLFLLVALVCSLIVFSDSMRGLMPILSETKGGAQLFINFIVVPLVPLLTMVFAGTVTRTFFATGEHGGLGGDFLIGTAAYLPGHLSFLLFYGVMRNFESASYEPESGLILFVMAVVFYSFCFLVMIILSGVTRINRIKEKTAAFIVPLMLFINFGLTFVVYKTLIFRT